MPTGDELLSCVKEDGWGRWDYPDGTVDIVIHVEGENLVRLSCKGTSPNARSLVQSAYDLAETNFSEATNSDATVISVVSNYDPTTDFVTVTATVIDYAS